MTDEVTAFYEREEESEVSCRRKCCMEKRTTQQGVGRKESTTHDVECRADPAGG